MTDPSKNRLVRLKYDNGSFPGHEWNEFLKNCGVNFYTALQELIEGVLAKFAKMRVEYATD